MRNVALGIVCVFVFFSPCILSAQEGYWESYLTDTGTTEDQWRKYWETILPGAMERHDELDRRRTKKLAELRQSGGTIEEYNAYVKSEEWRLYDEAEQKVRKENFTPAQIEKIQLRDFQTRHGVLKGIEGAGNLQDILMIRGITQSFSNMMPDFLELTPAQKEEIQKNFADYEAKSQMIRQIAQKNFKEEHPEEYDEWVNLLTIAGSEEERQKQMEQVQAMENRIYGGLEPELKKLLLQRNQKYMVVMTDAQKARIQKVMDDVPEYIWKAFPQNRDKDRPWRPGLDSWMPGMGVPANLGDTNREVRPTRKEGAKTFPGQEDD